MPRFDNSMPVYLLAPTGPGHALREDGTYTRCGTPATGAVEATYVQVHVWLHHAMCVQCFGPEGTKWP